MLKAKTLCSTHILPILTTFILDIKKRKKNLQQGHHVHMKKLSTQRKTEVKKKIEVNLRL
jgi:hypothetical protein